jgi:rhamnose transport system permease protein
MEEAISQAQAPLRTEQGWIERLFPNNEWILLIVIVVECLVFALAGNNFATTGNVFEISRLSVEIGLLALAMTPIIITAGSIFRSAR